MPIIYRLLICIAIATPVSALYNGFSQSGSIAYAFNSTAAIVFSLTAIICTLLCTVRFNRSVNSNGKPKKSGKKGKLQQGEIKWFNGKKGFGFIACDSGDEVFVHYRSIEKTQRRINPGNRVEFCIVEGEKGPEAANVCLI